MIEHEFPGKRGGFVHVPYAPQQVFDQPGQPALGIDEMATALAAASGRSWSPQTSRTDHSVGGDNPLTSEPCRREPWTTLGRAMGR